MVITDYLRDLALIADISNNIAHSVKNKEISKRFYLLKSISVSTIHREVKNNRDTIDIIDGFKEDTINGEKVKSYVIDIPGNGQLSWHLKKNVPSELQEDYDKKYPYGTIVRISNSKAGGPIMAIILDRGGAVGFGKATLFDLLFATEAEASSFGTSYNCTFEILRYGF